MFKEVQVQGVDIGQTTGEEQGQATVRFYGIGKSASLGWQAHSHAMFRQFPRDNMDLEDAKAEGMVLLLTLFGDN